MGRLWQTRVVVAGALGILAALPVGNAAHAALVYDTSAAAELLGGRSLGSPGVLLTTSGTGSAPTSFSVSWEIDYNVTTLGLWHYKYTFTYANGGGALQAISHLILDLSNDCTATTGCVIRAEFPSTSGATEYQGFTNGPSNPNLAGIIIGVKFDDTIGDSPFVVEFDSNRVPVYGDFYVKAGSQTNGWQAQNSGITLHASSQDILAFIARPDTLSIPAPASLALVGLGLIGIGALRLRSPT